MSKLKNWIGYPLIVALLAIAGLYASLPSTGDAQGTVVVRRQYRRNFINNAGLQYHQRYGAAAAGVANDAYGPDRFYVLNERQPAFSGKTVTITGSGTSRTCTASAAVFSAADVGGYVRTPFSATGGHAITAFTSTTVVTITTIAGYTNEAAVSFSVAGVSCSRTTGDTNALYAARLTQVDATAQRMGLAQIVCAEDTRALRSRSCRVKARIRCSASQAIRIALVEWTGTADSVTSNIVNSWTNSTYTTGNFFTSTTTTVTATAAITPSAATWTDIETTGTVSASANNLVFFVWVAGTLAQSGTLDVSQCGLLDGVDAAQWIPEDQTSDLVACQRYFRKNTPPDTAAANEVAVVDHYFAGAFAANSTLIYVPFPTPMRAAPTLTYYKSAAGTGTNGQWQIFDGDWNQTTAIIAQQTTTTGFFAQMSPTITSGTVVLMQPVWSADAEL